MAGAIASVNLIVDNAYPLRLCLLPMKRPTTEAAAETKARRGVRRLREAAAKTFPELVDVADSLEKLLDGASRGGKSRAKKLTKKRRKEIASNAAKVRWAKTRARAK